MAGLRGDVDSARAGEEGEYHHSRNLMKKMAVGRRSLRESRKRRGEVSNRRLINATAPFFPINGLDF